MHTVQAFEVGERYTNDQIRFSLSVENLGGIRPALDEQRRLRHVALLTANEDAGKLHFENPYQDRIEGDVLTYTAQGREGDQTLGGRNKRLLEQYNSAVPIFGFSNLGRQTYVFLGLLELLRHYQELQADKRGNLRRAWLFELRIHSQPSSVPLGEAVGLTRRILADSIQNLPEAQLERIVALPDPPPISESGLSEAEMRAKLMNLPPKSFEMLVGELFRHSGFERVSTTPFSGDGGIDLDAYAADADPFFAGTHVQAQVKRWRHSVGIAEINHFRGALSSTAKGVFVTTSYFTKAAIAEARHPVKPSLGLIDGSRLVELVNKTGMNLEV